MNSLRDLEEYLRFYDRNMPGSRANNRSGYGMSETSEAGAQLNAMDGHNAAARRMMFARQMMGRQGESQPGPDFYSGGGEAQAQQYVPPRENFLRTLLQGGRRG
jgi:hypothetical protein